MDSLLGQRLGSRGVEGDWTAGWGCRGFVSERHSVLSEWLAFAERNACYTYANFFDGNKQQFQKVIR